MKETRVAIRYAKALFDLCLEQNLLERLDQDMHMIETLHRDSREFRIFLRSPVISQKKKTSVLKTIFGSSVHSLTLSFSKLMVDNNRESIIGLVAREFHVLYREHKGILSVKLTTSSTLSETLRSEIIRIIREQTGKEIELAEEIDESLIGGFIVDIEDKQFDASILTKIKRLSREFDINIYEKGY